MFVCAVFETDGVCLPGILLCSRTKKPIISRPDRYKQYSYFSWSCLSPYNKTALWSSQPFLRAHKHLVYFLSQLSSVLEECHLKGLHFLLVEARGSVPSYISAMPNKGQFMKAKSRQLSCFLSRELLHFRSEFITLKSRYKRSPKKTHCTREPAMLFMRHVHCRNVTQRDPARDLSTDVAHTLCALRHSIPLLTPRACDAQSQPRNQRTCSRADIRGSYIGFVLIPRKEK